MRLVEFVPLSQSFSNVRLISLVVNGTVIFFAKGRSEFSEVWELLVALGRYLTSTVTVLASLL